MLLSHEHFKVWGDGGADDEVFLGEWMNDGELGSVKCEPFRSFFPFAFVAVFFIADDRASYVCEMDADLVFSTSDDF